MEQNDAWEDFHQEFLTRARSLLANQVEPDYYVKVEVRLYIHELSAEERRFFDRADAAVTTAAMREPTAAIAEIAAPMKLMMPAVETVRDSWLEVRDRRDRRVVTSLSCLARPIKSVQRIARHIWLNAT